jgi:glycerol-3-phosphate acyltransferase PlsY
MEALVVAGYFIGAFLLGAIPFSYLVTRAASGVDLRRVGTGTVSGSGVGVAAGFWPMAVAGLLDIGKGAAAVVPMAGERPMLAALGAGAAAVGHNWSPFLRGAGGRALSVAGGATMVMAWPGTVTLALGLAVGRLFRQTGLGAFVGQAALPAVLAVTDGAVGAALGGALVAPMWAKRILGNRPPRERRPATYLSRLLFDHDPGWVASD